MTLSPNMQTAFLRAGRLTGLQAGMLLTLTASLLLSGCTSIFSPIDGVPVHRVPRQFLATPTADWQLINLARLRQEQPRNYLLGPEDVLGIYIEGVLGTEEEPPPVHFPEDANSDLPPAIGFPTPVREDGTISLPLIPPIQVFGLTLSQVEDIVRRAYVDDRSILQRGNDRIIVTLMRKRTVRVIVIREDGGVGGDQLLAQQLVSGQRGGLFRGSTREGEGYVVDLPIYENDVMHALAETGGLPGLNAKNEVKILRGRMADAETYDRFVQEFYARYSNDICVCPPELPPDPSVVRIPLRLPPGVAPTFQPHEIILEEGDIVYIEARDAEVFYTGGLLPGGEWPIPRDYDLDVLGAMAVAGQGIGATAQAGTGGFLGVSGVSGAPPSQLFLIRKTPCNGQIVMSIDLNRAINDPRYRPLIQAGDTLILRYKPEEELFNFGIVTFFTYGLRELLSGN